jgi:hypothetical protein
MSMAYPHRDRGGDRCCCVCCREAEAPKLFYTVKPYDWKVGSGAPGTSYQIIEQRMIATSKCREDADKIAEALNGAKRKDRQIELLERKIECLENMPKGISIDRVKEVCEEELSSYVRWSTARKYVAESFDAVIKRLHAVHP